LVPQNTLKKTLVTTLKNEKACGREMRTENEIIPPVKQHIGQLFIKNSPDEVTPFKGIEAINTRKVKTQLPECIHQHR